MTTAQESNNGHRVLPPPCSLPDSQDENRSKDSTNNDPDFTPLSPTPATQAFPANAYHVPPKAFAPSPNPRQPSQYAESAKRLGTLPDRCQFMFSDGRQCTMARSDIHPSLCTYHSEREEQLFGDPFCESHIRGRSYDLPELFSASRDLTTAAGVNRALAQVFRLLAQRRISRQEAATFAKLGHLLLQSISAARQENLTSQLGSSGSAAKGYQQDALSPLNRVHPVAAPDVQISQRVEQPNNGVVERQKGVAITPFLPHENVERGISPKFSSAGPRPDLPLQPNEDHTLSTPEPATAVNASSQPQIPAAACDLTPIPRTPSPASIKERFAATNSAPHNPCIMSTYENPELKAIQNEHLQKNGGGMARCLGRSRRDSRRQPVT
jgi:hypothetical protein